MTRMAIKHLHADLACLFGLRISMSRFPMATYLPRNREARFATWMLGVGALLAPFVIQGQSVQVQSRDSVVSAMLQGSVRDSQGRPVAAASVYLRAEGGTQPLTAHTDSAGAFRFRSLRPWGERDEGG